MNDREKLADTMIELKGYLEEIYEFPTLDCFLKELAMQLIANGVTFQQWIPVTERLPEKDGSYLTFNKQNSVLLFTFFKDFGESGDYDLIGKKNIWCDYDSEYGYYECLDITHWMPLPSTEGLQ